MCEFSEKQIIFAVVCKVNRRDSLHNDLYSTNLIIKKTLWNKSTKTSKVTS